MNLQPTCDYYGCEWQGSVVEVFPGWYVCPTCEDKINDSSGYCSYGCMFGYGCDDSC